MRIGSGCGLLGIALAHLGCSVLLTETADALPNLVRNVESNQPLAAGGGSCAAAQLHWGDEVDTRSAVARGPWDVLVGTDVVYQAENVLPLLQTLWRLANATTTCWLCGSVRCQDAHQVLLQAAPGFFASVEQVPLDGIPYADDLELQLWKLQAPHL